jgi:hypothetical protein
MRRIYIYTYIYIYNLYILINIYQDKGLAPSTPTALSVFQLVGGSFNGQLLPHELIRQALERPQPETNSTKVSDLVYLLSKVTR